VKHLLPRIQHQDETGHTHTRTQTRTSGNSGSLPSVEHPHGVASAIDRRHDEDDSVRDDAEVPVAQHGRLLRRHHGHRRIPVVHLKCTQQSAGKPRKT